MRLATLLALGAGLFAAVATPSSADVTAVTGSASGASVPNLTLFGGVPPGVPFGPTPTVTLAADASNSPQTATAPSIAATFGPASIFSSGAVTVSSEGTLGAGGSVTSSADIASVNTSQSEVFTASRLQSTCTASESGASGSTTVTDGTIFLQDPDPDASGEAGEQVVNIPTNPPANTTYDGTIAPPVSDNFQAIFNEQVMNADGSITVTAYHLRMLGPTAVGDLYVGQVVCGVTGTGVGTTTTVPTGATTTVPTGATTTVPTGATTTVPTGATTTVPTGATTTTRVQGTTTTRAGGSTTTSSTMPAVGATTVPPSRQSILARTGSRFQSLIVLSFLTLVLGALALTGLSARLASAGPGSGSGPWAALVRQAVARRRRRRPWHKRRWS